MQSQPAVISGQLATGKTSDTVILIMHGEFSPLGNPEFLPAFEQTIISSGGRFSFATPPLEGPVRVNFYVNTERITTHNILRSDSALINYYVEPGDRIQVTGKPGAYHFSGKGAAKWQYEWEVDSILHLFASRRKEYADNKAGFNHIRFNTDRMNGQRQLLDRYKGRISETMDFIYRANLRTGAYGHYYTSVRAGLRGDSDRVRQAQQLYEQYLTNISVDTASSALLLLSFYPEFLLLKEETDAAYALSLGRLPAPGIYQRISSRYSGTLRDKLLLMSLDREVSRSEVTDSSFAWLLDMVETPRYRKRLEALMASFVSGKPVVDFAFRDRENKVVRLSDFKGKVIFLDMWFTGCGGCVAVAKALPEVEEAFKDRTDVVFVSLSVDLKREEWLPSVDGNRKLNQGTTKAYTHYTTPSTIYLYTAGTGSANDFIRQYVPGAAFPHLLLVGKDGNLFSASPPNPAHPDGKEQLIALIRQALGS
ncbi:MAG: TlpA disulfide reductase family protein [Candidatus Pseudobacter hemicellulosilyticus]|uniref:TlpA disulfide reductase family protein n=1 Tax=Candidatus Pseudobacter hemicellulosilyticus TaxID=3121375 RepID=A0AAJ6BFH2_9BACT|nr:MAG: TlpA disulfide reductase family protein [Pseudobacter sp.]